MSRYYQYRSSLEEVRQDIALTKARLPRLHGGYREQLQALNSFTNGLGQGARLGMRIALREFAAELRDLDRAREVLTDEHKLEYIVESLAQRAGF